MKNVFKDLSCLEDRYKEIPLFSYKVVRAKTSMNLDYWIGYINYEILYIYIKLQNLIILENSLSSRIEYIFHKMKN